MRNLIVFFVLALGIASGCTVTVPNDDVETSEKSAALQLSRCSVGVEAALWCVLATTAGAKWVVLGKIGVGYLAYRASVRGVELYLGPNHEQAIGDMTLYMDRVNPQGIGKAYKAQLGPAVVWYMLPEGRVWGGFELGYPALPRLVASVVRSACEAFAPKKPLARGSCIGAITVLRETNPAAAEAYARRGRIIHLTDDRVVEEITREIAESQREKVDETHVTNARAIANGLVLALQNERNRGKICKNLNERLPPFPNAATENAALAAAIQAIRDAFGIDCSSKLTRTYRVPVVRNRRN